MGIDCYYMPPSAPSRAVLLAAKHLGVELNLKVVNLLAGEQMKPEFLALNPQHGIPTLNDSGFILSESRPILQYLANAYGKETDNDDDDASSVYPTNPKRRFLVDQRLAFDMGSLYLNFQETYYPTIFAGATKLDKEKMKKFKEALNYLEGFLKKTVYVAGDHLTIADFSFAATLATVEAVGHDLSPYPGITQYLAKLKKELLGYAELNQAGATELGSWYKAAAAAAKI